MKAIQVAEFGGPEVLKLNEVPTPKPEAGQVLVKVHAAGVNPYDTYMRTGTYAIKPPLPYTPGSDAAGVVEAVGAGVKSLKPGDRVYTAKTITGAYAEYTLTLEAQAQKLPSNISFEQGAGVWVPYGTAYHAIFHEAKVRASETVLVHGASGGVGSASVQMLHAMGCTVFGTASSPAGPGPRQARRRHTRLQSQQSRLHRRNHEGHQRPRRRRHSGNAGQRESRPRSEDAGAVRPRHRDRQSRRSHHQRPRPDGPPILSPRIHAVGHHGIGNRRHPRRPLRRPGKWHADTRSSAKRSRWPKPPAPTRKSWPQARSAKSS